MNSPTARVRRAAPPATGWLRWARAGSVAGSASALAAGGHVLAGGAPPSPGILTVAFIPLLAATLACTGTRLRVWAATLLLGGQQLALHHVFMAATHGAAPLPGGHHLPRHGPATDALGATEMSGMAPGMDWPMTLAHLGAALLVAVVVAGIDRVLFFLAELFARPVRVLTGVAARIPDAAVPMPRRRGGVPGVERDVAPSRGPPRPPTAAWSAPRAALLG